MNETCSNCQFYKTSAAIPGPLATYGECKRHSPVVMDRAWTHAACGLQHETATAWPETRSDDWCGDYVRKPL